jgi:hypothetical protein
MPPRHQAGGKSRRSADRNAAISCKNLCAHGVLRDSWHPANGVQESLLRRIAVEASVCIAVKARMFRAIYRWWLLIFIHYHTVVLKTSKFQV